MEESQMLYAGWLAQGVVYNIMLVQIPNARDVLYRTAQATAWKREDCILFYLEVVGCLFIFIFLLVTVSANFETYGAPHAISSLCSLTF